jgi:hypothetical protein
MSGGSYNYEYCRVDDEYVGRMYDAELDELIKDLVPVLKAVEWWKSCDTCEETYREEVLKFKKKWLSDDVRTERLSEIINGKVEELREELLKMIGVIGFGSEDT